MLYYVLKHLETGQYFQEANLYLGTSEICGLQAAKLMTKNEALATFENMKVKSDWSVMKVKKGWVEAGVERTHYDLLQEQKNNLEKQLSEVNSQLGVIERRKVEPVPPEDDPGIEFLSNGFG